MILMCVDFPYQINALLKSSKSKTNNVSVVSFCAATVFHIEKKN